MNERTRFIILLILLALSVALLLYLRSNIGQNFTNQL